MGVGQRREVQGCWRGRAALGRRASGCCVVWSAGRELDAGVELRRARCELCWEDERADDGVDELDCFWFSIWFAFCFSIGVNRFIAKSTQLMGL